MRGLACVVITLGLTATAAAQNGERRSDADAPDAIIEFDDDFVTGGTDDPYGLICVIPAYGRIHSLIRPRLHFVPELLKSVERM